MRTRSLHTVAAVLVLAGAARAQDAAGPTSRPDAAAVIDAIESAKTPAAAAEALRHQGLTPATVTRLLRAGPAFPVQAAGRHQIQMTAGGRSTQAVFIVPRGYDPARKWPVIVALHGLGGNCHQMARIFGPLVDQMQMILACPTATAPSDVAPFIRNMVWKMSPRRQWWSYAEQSFPLATLREAKHRFNVDENRVYLTGYSMGGFGSWNISLRYWDRFAAVAPMAGGLAPSEGMSGKNGALRRLLDNGVHLPFFVVHGGNDTLVPVLFSRWNTTRLKQLGAECEYHEVPNAGHVLPPAEFRRLMPKLVEFFKAHTRGPLERTVHHVALAPTHGLAGWVRIDASAGAAAADVTAVFPADPATGPVAITASGATVLSVFVPDAWVTGAATVRIEVNGTVLDPVEADPLEALADAWLARRDRTRTFRRRLRVTVPAPAGSPKPKETEDF